jgi:DNA-binding LytR/AlgR family response regulator
MHGIRKAVISIEDIFYMEVEDDMVIFFLRNGREAYEIRPLTELEYQFAEYGFIRIHHKTLVNGKYITEACKHCVKVGEKYLRISKSRQKAVNNWLFQNPITDIFS